MLFSIDYIDDNPFSIQESHQSQSKNAYNFSNLHYGAHQRKTLDSIVWTVQHGDHKNWRNNVIHFESVFNTATATQLVFQRPVKAKELIFYAKAKNYSAFNTPFVRCRTDRSKFYHYIISKS
ncbi:hypothetical protein Nit79A3_1547 [Nitrosomonas sp. Is79A3]